MLRGSARPAVRAPVPLGARWAPRRERRKRRNRRRGQRRRHPQSSGSQSGETELSDLLSSRRTETPPSHRGDRRGTGKRRSGPPTAAGAARWRPSDSGDPEPSQDRQAPADRLRSCGPGSPPPSGPGGAHLPSPAPHPRTPAPRRPIPEAPQLRGAPSPRRPSSEAPHPRGSPSPRLPSSKVFQLLGARFGGCSGRSPPAPRPRTPGAGRPLGLVPGTCPRLEAPAPQVAAAVPGATMSAAAGGAAQAGLSGRVPDPLREANASANSSLPPRGALRWELGPEPAGGGPGPGDAAEARVRLLLSAAYWAVCALGLAGNLLVLCLLRSRRAGRASAIRLFVTHLALTDLQFVLTLPFWAVEHARDFRWPFGGAMCKLVSLATSVNMYGSVFFLTAMSVARYRSVASALGRRGGRGGRGCGGRGCGGPGCGGRGARALCALIWAAAVLASLPNGLFATAVPVLGQELCLLRFPGRGQFWLGLYHLQKVLLGFLLPLAVTSLSYLLLLRALAERRVAAAPGGAPEARGGLAAAASARRRSRVTRSVSVLVLAFFLCWLPNQALTAWGALVKLGAAPFSRAFFLGQAYAFPASVCLAHANSCLNPLLYCLARRDCRRALRALLGRLAKPSLPGLARPCTASTRPDPRDPAPPGPAPRRPPAEPEPRFYPPGAVVYSGGRQDPLPSSSAS